MASIKGSSVRLASRAPGHVSLAEPACIGTEFLVWQHFFPIDSLPRSVSTDEAMSRVTYFPRYSNYENVVTNTTLHLFSQIYQQSADRLRTLLTELLGGEELPLGIDFQQQLRKGSSVPDGSILQEPLHIVIETKVEAGVNDDQLVRHCEAFTHKGPGNYLMLLTKHDVPTDQLEVVMVKAKEHSVIFKHITFEELVKHLEHLAYPHETHLRHVIDDFRSYCTDMELFPDRRKWLRIVPCGMTHSLNAKWNVYYQPIERNYSQHEYLGIYNQKSVRLVGRVAALYDNESDGSDGMKLKLAEGTGNPVFEDRIRHMVADTKALVGWDVSHGHRFFCVHKFAPTAFNKISSGGIQGPRFWDITDLVDPGMTDEQLAEVLKQKEWE